MDKLTSILAVAEDGAGAAALLDKAVYLAPLFNARLELMSDDLSVIEILAARRAERRYDEVTMRGVSRNAGHDTEIVLREAALCGADIILLNSAISHRELAEESHLP